jgi:hypothetical protein
LKTNLTRALWLLLVVVGVVAVAGAPAAAHASTEPVQVLQYCNYDVNGDGVRLRTQPSSSSTVLGLLYRGELVNGDSGNRQNGFNYIWSSQHQRWGWVASQYLSVVNCP